MCVLASAEVDRLHKVTIAKHCIATVDYKITLGLQQMEVDKPQPPEYRFEFRLRLFNVHLWFVSRT